MPAGERFTARPLWCSEASDVSPLPGSLDRLRVVMLADERHGFTGGHAVDHRNAGECGTCSSASATTCNFHPLLGSTAPRFVQRVLGIVAVGGQTEVRPANPPYVPWHGLRLLFEQVDAEVRNDAIERGTAQATATATDQPARR